jgi:hypothetical protein
MIDCERSEPRCTHPATEMKLWLATFRGIPIAVYRLLADRSAWVPKIVEGYWRLPVA